MHAHDEHVLVMRAVEDGELPRARGAPVDPPQEIVLALLGRRDAEGGDVDPARVERADHVLDRAVFAGRVAPLKDDEDAVRPRAPHELLELEQLFAELTQPRDGLVFDCVLGRVGGDVVQAELRVGFREARYGHTGHRTRSSAADTVPPALPFAEPQDLLPPRRPSAGIPCPGGTSTASA